MKRTSGVILALVLAALPAALAAQQNDTVRTLSLEDAVRLALPASEQVGIALAERIRASGQIKRAYAEFLPQITLSGQYTRQIKSQYSSGSTSSAPATCPSFNGQPGTNEQRLDSLEKAVNCLTNENPFAAFSDLPFARPNQWNFGIAYSQTLFNGSIINGRTTAAKAGRQLAELGITSAQAQLVLDVTTAYYDAQLTDQLVAIAQLALDQSDTTLRQTELGLKVGSSAEFDVLRARVSRDNTRVTLIQQQASREVALYRLKQLVLLPLDRPVSLTTPLASTETDSLTFADTLLLGAQDSLTKERSAIREAEETETIQRIIYKIADAQWWPSLSITSRYGQLAYPSSTFPGANDFRTDWNVGVLLNFPIWTSGRFKGDAQVAQADFEQAQLRTALTRKLAAIDTRQVVSRLLAARAAWVASIGTVSQANRAYQIAELRYREGLSSLTELNDARLGLAQAQVNRATAARDFQVALTRLELLPDLPIGTAGAADAANQATVGPVLPRTTGTP
ncbi:MAG TPA: TolC family protein [Spirochaetia bacterium]|nr:TolC family protein [Spirochaetia bacterium]